MRILVYGVNFFPELTGIGKYTGEMADWLASRGHEIIVVTAPPYYPEWKIGDGYANAYRKTRRGNLTIVRCPLWIPSLGKGGPGGLKRLLHLFTFALTSLPILLGVLLVSRPQVIWTVEPSLMSAMNLRVLNLFFRKPSWMHIQDFEVDAAFELNILRGNAVRSAAAAVERWIMLGFDRVSTISRKMLEKLEKKGLPEAKVRAFPNWIDLSSIHPLSGPNEIRRALDISDDEIVVLYSGNLGEKQGVDALVELAQLWDESPRIRMILCGAGASQERVKQDCAGLSRLKIIPLQPLEKLNALLNSADIHLLPQKAGVVDLVMPSKLTGMLASGRPVVAMATPDSDVSFALRDCGFVVPPGKIDEFRARVEMLADQPDLRKRMGAAARRVAEKELSRDAVIGVFENELKGLTGNA